MLEHVRNPTMVVVDWNLVSEEFGYDFVTSLAVVKFFRLLSSVMSAIIDVKCVLTQKALDAFCNKCHIPEEVHPILPNQNDTIATTEAQWEKLSKCSDNAHGSCSSGRLTLSIKIMPFYDDHPLVSEGFRKHYRMLEMDIFAFIHTSDPTKVKIVERERNEGEPLLLETTIDRTVPLLPVAPDRAESELEACVERLFDEGGSGNQTEQGDSIGDVKDANIQPVNEAANTVIEDVAPVQPKRQGKRKSVVVDAGPQSRGCLLENPGPTLPFMIASVSTTPEREGGDHTDSVAGLNLRTIGAPRRFVISFDSSHHSGTNVAEAEVDSLVRSSVLIMTTVTTVTSAVDPASAAKEKLVKPSPFFAGSSSAGGTDPTTSVFLDLTGSDFFVGAIRTVIDLDTDL
ncbi:hypothetical protein Tco_0933752 [Tanacetum coccineum]